MIHKRISLISLLLAGTLFFSPALHGQPIPNDDISTQLDGFRKMMIEQKKAVWGVSIGLHVELNKKRKSAFRLFSSFALAQVVSQHQWHAIGGFQTEIELYRGGLGSSLLNTERNKINVEWRNIPLLGVGFGNTLPLNGRPLFVSIGQSMGALYNPFDYSVSLGSYFINGINHKRNQQLGFVSIGLNFLNLYYANDGPPFGGIGLGDRFDRYWTGSGELGFYYAQGGLPFVSAAMRYDKFSGYQPLLYELGTMLQIDNLPYAKKGEQFYNQSRFQYRFGMRNGLLLGYSKYQPVKTDVQNLIHFFGRMPYHASPLGPHRAFIMEYQFRSLNAF